MPGRAIVFDNLRADGSPDPDSLHAGLPVERGEKWLATLWIRQYRYRDFQGRFEQAHPGFFRGREPGPGLY